MVTAVGYDICHMVDLARSGRLFGPRLPGGKVNHSALGLSSTEEGEMNLQRSARGLATAFGIKEGMPNIVGSTSRTAFARAQLSMKKSMLEENQFQLIDEREDTRYATDPFAGDGDSDSSYGGSRKSLSEREENSSSSEEGCPPPPKKVREKRSEDTSDDEDREKELEEGKRKKRKKKSGRKESEDRATEEDRHARKGQRGRPPGSKNKSASLNSKKSAQPIAIRTGKKQPGEGGKGRSGTRGKGTRPGGNKNNVQEESNKTDFQVQSSSQFDAPTSSQRSDVCHDDTTARNGEEIATTSEARNERCMFTAIPESEGGGRDFLDQGIDQPERQQFMIEHLSSNLVKRKKNELEKMVVEMRSTLDEVNKRVLFLKVS